MAKKIVEQLEEPCLIIQEILNVVIPNNDSLAELNQRIKINNHLKECRNSKCNELRVHRINTGLY